eukprot:CAMPEP_0114494242 /NCGR_PEP_ID=MMETSP0109-20121206/4550_1 /TAXON_ID=29199 /ORGANISM="Chlorarachnion reptans, Strain CCCM449" /LENGTH=370 /DNA_ID=CAMNT_0001671271 /DNA_START=331 /DNA_END=1443 /DNA_ORIENTATION=+
MLKKPPSFISKIALGGMVLTAIMILVSVVGIFISNDVTWLAFRSFAAVLAAIVFGANCCFCFYQLRKMMVKSRNARAERTSRSPRGSKGGVELRNMRIGQRSSHSARGSKGADDLRSVRVHRHASCTRESKGIQGQQISHSTLGSKGTYELRGIRADHQATCDQEPYGTEDDKANEERISRGTYYEENLPAEGVIQQRSTRHPSGTWAHISKTQASPSKPKEAVDKFPIIATRISRVDTIRRSSGTWARISKNRILPLKVPMESKSAITVPRTSSVEAHNVRISRSILNSVTTSQERRTMFKLWVLFVLGLVITFVIVIVHSALGVSLIKSDRKYDETIAHENKSYDILLDAQGYIGIVMNGFIQFYTGY